MLHVLILNMDDKRWALPGSVRLQTALPEHEHRKRWKGLSKCHEMTLMTHKQTEKNDCWMQVSLSLVESWAGGAEMCLRCESPLTRWALTPQWSWLFPRTAPCSSHALHYSPLFSNLLLLQMWCRLTQTTLTSKDMSKLHFLHPLSCRWVSVLSITEIPACCRGSHW